MSTFKVQTPALFAASAVIGQSASSADDAQSSARAAAGQAGAFADEPIGSAFAALCSRGEEATGELSDTITELTRNVAAASVGYRNTEFGLISSWLLATKGNPV